jgi:murein DD-endopeptidase MepM/ murein hydrolase activator NlpD
MTSKALTYLVCGVVGLTLSCIGGLIGLSGSALACAEPITSPSSGPSAQPVAGYDTEQRANATIIMSVGTGRGIPARGQIIAVATAIQESSLRNVGNLGRSNDHDSLGLFQQRPSQGWGTPQQIMNPVYAAGEFYDKLLAIDGWQHMPLAQAAQAVQRSAYPDAYAKWEADATALVGATPNGGAHCDASTITATGWTNPLPGHHPIVSGFRTSSRPTHNGVDLGAARYTQIHAAAAGTVIVSKCDVGDCDHDGSPSTPGCGWFVDILHADRVITRYCHMLQRPFVSVGDQVQAGQVIGLVGTSGHSSGPHLHFETHLNGDRSFEGGVDPVPFMAARGVLLG